MNIAINTRKYSATHNQEPKGVGSWWFEILNCQYVYRGTYTSAASQARKEASRQYKRFGVTSDLEVVLMP